MLSKHIWLLQMLCQHLANIAQEKSQASIEDKIVWNNDIVVTIFLPYDILYMLLFLSIHKGFSF